MVIRHGGSCAAEQLAVEMIVSGVKAGIGAGRFGDHGAVLSVVVSYDTIIGGCQVAAWIIGIDPPVDMAATWAALGNPSSSCRGVATPAPLPWHGSRGVPAAGSGPDHRQPVGLGNDMPEGGIVLTVDKQ